MRSSSDGSVTTIRNTRKSIFTLSAAPYVHILQGSVASRGRSQPAGDGQKVWALWNQDAHGQGNRLNNESFSGAAKNLWKATCIETDVDDLLCIAEHILSIDDGSIYLFKIMCVAYFWSSNVIRVVGISPKYSERSWRLFILQFQNSYGFTKKMSFDFHYSLSWDVEAQGALEKWIFELHNTLADDTKYNHSNVCWLRWQIAASLSQTRSSLQIH